MNDRKIGHLADREKDFNKLTSVEAMNERKRNCCCCADAAASTLVVLAFLYAVVLMRADAHIRIQTQFTSLDTKRFFSSFFFQIKITNDYCNIDMVDVR